MPSLPYDKTSPMSLEQYGYYKYSSEETIPIDGEHRRYYVTFAKNAYYSLAKKSAEKLIKELICSLNFDVDDLIVEVDFYDGL